MDTVDTPIEENNEVIIPVLLIFEEVILPSVAIPVLLIFEEFMFATLIFGVPLKLNAVEAIPVTFPTNP